MGAILKVRAWRVALLTVFVSGLSAAVVTAQETSAAQAGAVVGPADAPYVITVYSDFACQACGRLAVVLEALVASAPQNVRIVFKHAPAANSGARAAHLAAAAAAQQGRFWEMHTILFANQDRLSAQETIAMAAQIGLDMPRFQAALASAEVAAVVEADMAEATRLGVSATPYCLINGTPFLGMLTLENLSRATGRR
jgi:protein-disulfide isomerase